MNMNHTTKRSTSRSRRGMSLLELVLTMALVGILISPVAALLTASHSVWEAQDSDHTRLEAAHATVRHLVRRIRQAEAVTAISAPTDTNGSITARMPDGRIFVWARQGNKILFGEDTATDLLSEGMSELSFIGYRKDGVSQTTDPNLIQIVKCTVRCRLARQRNAARTMSSWIWLRTTQ